MSRKHFVKIAATLKAQLEAASTPEAKEAVKAVIRALADDFSDFNPNFCWRTFAAACGLDLN
jgi:hypothetical protein